MRISMIVAADESEVIGRDGALPWHLPEDLKRFKALTMGHVVITGRLTQDSIVARLGGPLPGRLTIVVTRQAGLVDTPDVRYTGTVAEALEKARAAAGDGEVFVIGGAQIYAAVLPVVRKVYLTRVHTAVDDGDTRLAEDWLEPFDLVEAAVRQDGYSFLTYERRSLYYLGNARTELQLEDMRRLEADGVCVFCPDHRDQVLVVHQTPHWTVVPNRFPYRGTETHLLLIPDEHVDDLADLSPTAQADFWTVLGWAREEYGFGNYGLAVRNGNPAYTGGTIRHVHVHVLTGDVENPDHEPVRVKLTSRPPD